MSARPFFVNVAALKGRPGEREEIERKGPLDELATSGATVDPQSDVSFVGTLESIEGGRIVVVGDVRAEWSGDCRRCLGPAVGVVDSRVREIFERDATEGETYPLNNDHADLEPLLRESIMLELPIAPLCKDDCAGLCPECGIDKNKETCDCIVDLSDPRWAALNALKDDD